MEKLDKTDMLEYFVAKQCAPLTTAEIASERKCSKADIDEMLRPGVKDGLIEKTRITKQQGPFPISYDGYKITARGERAWESSRGIDPDQVENSFCRDFLIRASNNKSEVCSPKDLGFTEARAKASIQKLKDSGLVKDTTVSSGLFQVAAIGLTPKGKEAAEIMVRENTRSPDVPVLSFK